MVNVKLLRFIRCLAWGKNEWKGVIEIMDILILKI